eukprot:m.164434 g.164434  ORF g.164434 m.164434 type:complete len:106 (+) comp31340_c2_seq2:1743-2060(+)
MCEFKAIDTSDMIKLSEETCEKIDELYLQWKESRNGKAHPTCLMPGNALGKNEECDHDNMDCQNRKDIYDYITNTCTFPKVNKKLIEQCSIVSEKFASENFTNML